MFGVSIILILIYHSGVMIKIGNNNITFIIGTTTTRDPDLVSFTWRILLIDVIDKTTLSMTVTI